MSKARVLFLTDRGERHQRAALKAAPPELEVIMKRHIPEVELLALLSDIDFLISERNQPVTAKMLEAAPRLKLIVRLGSLAYDIDVETVKATGTQLSLQPVIGTIYVAEHVLMMMLATLKRLGRSLWATNTAAHGLAGRRTNENTFAFNWLDYPDIGGLFDKTVAIVGMGEIGVELARRLKPFGLKYLYYNKRSRYPQAIERELWLSYGSLLECAERADVLVSLLPFSEATDRSIHAGTFQRMKPTAVLVHAGSGSVIDEQALVEALRDKRLAGAALDTYEYEPLQPSHSLVQLARDPNSNLLLTPHVAGASLPDTRADDYSEILRYLAHEPLKFEIV